MANKLRQRKNKNTSSPARTAPVTKTDIKNNNNTSDNKNANNNAPTNNDHEDRKLATQEKRDTDDVTWKEMKQPSSSSSSFHVTPLIELHPLLRWDVGPFAVLYAGLMAADYYYYDNDHNEQTTTTIITILLALTLILHASLVMATQWSVPWKVRVGYRPQNPQASATTTSRMQQWTHAYVVGQSHNNSAGSIMGDIVPLHCVAVPQLLTSSLTDNKNNKTIHSNNNNNAPTITTATAVPRTVAVVNFHEHILRYCPEGMDGDEALWTTNTSTSSSAQSSTNSNDNDNKATPSFIIPQFRPLMYPINLPLSFYAQWQGFSNIAQMTLANQVYGPNQTILQLPSFITLLGEQLVAPFFLFQVFCVVLWSLDEYWYYALFTLAALLLFESTLAFQRQQSLQRLHHRATASLHQRIWVRRQTGLPSITQNSAVWMSLPRTELIPGDIVSVGVNAAEGTVVPADMVILHAAAAVCDEALLTGESVPQLKQALDSSGNSARLDLQDPLHKESILFAGTKLLVANYEDPQSDHHYSMGGGGNPASPIPAGLVGGAPPDNGVVGMVLRTGFETVQGNLLRSMAHSARTADGGLHNWDTFVFIVMLIVCAVFAAFLVLQEGWHDERRNRFRLVLHVIIIVTSVVPPELPMELSLAVTNSVAALVRKSQVYCSELFRIPWAGEVNVCCFDKTGTLTSDEMRLRGVRLPPAKRNGQLEDDSLVLPQENPIPRETLRVMIACHSLTSTAAPSPRQGGNGYLTVVGDPLEQAVLNKSGYRLVGNNLVAPVEKAEEAKDSKSSKEKAMTILHRFAFSSKLKRMTVLATEEGSKGELWALTKGAPETLKPLMDAGSIPEDYDEIAFHHMSLGRRVLAMAEKSIGTLANLQSCKEEGRHVIEKGLHFVGFLVLDCPLKPDSKDVIKELKKTGHNTVMITGDAILTAVEVARQVAIIPSDPSSLAVYKVLLKSVQSRTRVKEYSFECVDISGKISKSLPLKREDIPKLVALHRKGMARFCMEGEVLIQLAQMAISSNQSPTNNEDEKNLLLQPLAQEFLAQLVPIVSVFARHAPHQKEAVVAAFNHGGYQTLMVGDGTNDVGALKRAHVGISIISAPEVEAKQRKASDTLNQMKKKKKGTEKSKRRRLEQSLQQLREAQEELDQVELGDASVAAPFTSRAVSIKCVKDVIQQGRCTLVTMLQIYKILGINCLVNAMVLSNLFLHGVKQGDRQLTILGMAVATLFYFVTRAEPLPTLSETRPPSSVLCLQALVSIVMQFCVHLGAIALATEASLVFQDPWDPSLVPDGPFNPNVLNSCTFMLTCVATVNTFAVNYRGRPFMQDLHQNKLMYRSRQCCYAIFAICALEVFPPLNDLMQLTALPDVKDRIIEPRAAVLPLIQIIDSIGFPFFIFALMILDTVLAFSVERFARSTL